MIPQPPSRDKSAQRARKKSDKRMVYWPLAFAAGIGIGIAAYRYVPNVDFYFDHWVALFL